LIADPNQQDEVEWINENDESLNQLYLKVIQTGDPKLFQGEVMSLEEEKKILAKAPKGKSNLIIVKSKGGAWWWKHGEMQHEYKKPKGCWYTQHQCKVKNCDCARFMSKTAYDNRIKR